MKPGATMWPVASRVRLAPSRRLPIATILPLRIPISPRYAGMRMPSMTVPFRITRSYSAIAKVLLSLNVDMVERDCVLEDDLPRDIVGNAREVARDNLARLGPGRVGMWKVRRPHVIGRPE